MSAVADILDRAADLIEPEGAWTQKAFARGKSGRPVEPKGRAAVCFCAVGALERAKGTEWTAPERRFLYKILPEQGSIMLWNDEPLRTQAEVVAKLREAAALARGEQS